MSLLMRWLASVASIAATDGVERDANGTPTAFRIWRAGENRTDHGTHTFSKASAQALMAEQAVRGNLYSIDVDHLSLDKQAPPESRKAVGWHRLEVRDGELWAVDVEWTDAVRAGLTKTPPEWRYFSPAYDTEKKTGEIVSYLNTALTNNPATWSVTALATRRGPMNLQSIAAALFGDDPEKKKEARATIAAMSDLEQKAWKAYQKAALDGGDDDAPAAESKATEDEPAKEPTKAAEEPAKEPAGDEGEKAAIAAKRAAEGEALAKLGEQDRRIAQLEKVKEEQDRATILATRPDLTKSQLEVLAKKPVAELPDYLALIPAPAVDPAAAARVTATRGNARGGGGEFGAQRAARLPAKENAELRQRMGTADEEPKSVHWDPDKPNDLVFPAMRPEHARRILAARAKAGLDTPEFKPAGKAAGGAR